MTEADTNAAITAIIAKRDEILKERLHIRAERDRLAMRDRELDRELADCQAAARLFGAKIEFPSDEPSEDSATRRRFFYDANLFRSHLVPKQLIQAAAEIAGPHKPHEQKALEAIQEALNLSDPPTMPRISDVVLDRLKAAGSNGSKAAPIQAYIESTYGKKIHDKTVGMTLYRLAKDELVRRDGHTWFITEKGMNPGAATPGPLNVAG